MRPHHSTPLVAICFLLTALLLLPACETEEAEIAGALQLRIPDSDDLLGGAAGDVVRLPITSPREARIVILDGIWTQGGARSVEVAQVLDSEVFVKETTDGDPHWITRATVRNAAGEVIWAQRVNSLFQLLEFLQVVLDGQGDVSFTSEQVYQLVVSQYPELIQFAVRVPIALPGGQTYHLELREPDGTWIELGSFSIDSLLAQAQPPTIEAEVTDLARTGPDDDRLTIAILGDGYTASERLRFEADAQAVMEHIITTSPLREHSDLMNIKAVWTPSEESGAGYDCNHSGAPAGCEQGFRDTVYETVFVIPAIMDQFNMPLGDVSDRVAMPLQLSRMFEAGALANYDEILLISNSAKRSGFAGLYVALVTSFDARIHFPHVAVHELGHTLGLLGDEYNVPGDSCYYNEPTIPLPANIAQIEDGDVKWSDWFDDSTPVPTPPQNASDHPVGAYLGAYNCDDLVRPAHRCKMNSSLDDFCAVCSEQLVRRLYSFVDPLPLDENVVALRVASDIAEIHPTMRSRFERYEIHWTLNGEPLPVTGQPLRLEAADLVDFPRDQWLTLEAVVRNASGFLRTSDAEMESVFHFEIMLEE